MKKGGNFCKRRNPYTPYYFSSVESLLFAVQWKEDYSKKLIFNLSLILEYNKYRPTLRCLHHLKLIRINPTHMVQLLICQDIEILKYN